MNFKVGDVVKFVDNTGLSVVPPVGTIATVISTIHCVGLIIVTWKDDVYNLNYGHEFYPKRFVKYNYPNEQLLFSFMESV